MTINSTDPVGSIVVPTTFGVHSYQILVNYTDLQGETSEIFSNLQYTAILTDNEVTANGSISISNLARDFTSNKVGFNYVINSGNVDITSVTAEIYSVINNSLIETVDLGQSLSGSFTTTNPLMPSTPHNVFLKVETSKGPMLLDTKTFTTPPTDLVDGSVFTNLYLSKVTATSVDLQLLVVGTEADLAAITEIKLTLDDGQVFTYDGDRLDFIKSGIAGNATIYGLTPNTHYVATVEIFGPTTDLSSDVTASFRTDGSNNGSTQVPTFNTNLFVQNSFGDAEVLSY